MLEYLFGSRNVERILLYLLVNERAYAAGLAKEFKVSLYSLQKIFMKLEQGGVLVSRLEGKTRIYQFNPRYLFIKELKAFLSSVYETIPPEILEKSYAPLSRKRPRRSGKPL